LKIRALLPSLVAPLHNFASDWYSLNFDFKFFIFCVFGFNVVFVFIFITFSDSFTCYDLLYANYSEYLYKWSMLSLSV
jgi:hypothetical protein